ncbi:hypothetical protein [uncultured Veillonella sp.]|uniref:hypothetical protein n=1 Tax=uncultured Veillonella sp. TaxID=159268 RepID=UPI0025DCA941|nr:hypothetical protein [uncultured Veillonella sp.]
MTTTNKTYKDVEKTYIGDSDIASLTLSSPEGVYRLNFGENGDYNAYILPAGIEIPAHYSLRYECRHWLTIFDDLGRKFNYHSYGAQFKIYRAGMRGVIIQIIEPEEK